MLDFNERLARLGLSGADAKDGLIQTKVQVTNLEELRQVLDTGADDTQRQKLHSGLFDGIEAQDDGLVERLHEYVFGNGELSDADREAVAPMFPLTLYVTAAPGPKTINSKWDLSTPDGQMQVVVLTDFTMDDGGYVVCYKSPLQFTCDTLTRNGKSGVSGDFNILGATGADIPPDGPPPTPGQARSGEPGQCSSAGIAGKGGGNGKPGATGTAGAPGTRGNDGIASQLAHITVTKGVTVPAGTQIVIATRSGTGGAGQPGGRGGAGGKGGNGGNGKTCGCTGNGGGSGEIGGRGGEGGPGGPGGNAVNASANVVVAAPSAELAKFLQGGLTQDVPPGSGGTGGGPGSGGPGGSGGSGGKDNHGGSSGGTGPAGVTGPQGSPGTQSGKPAQVVLQPY